MRIVEGYFGFVDLICVQRCGVQPPFLFLLNDGGHRFILMKPLASEFETSLQSLSKPISHSDPIECPSELELDCMPSAASRPNES